MPVYNAEKYLNRSIQSILNQSVQDFELIIVNDGSTDSSEAICQKFASKDSRIKFISQPNSGASAARNTALSLVTSPWVTFCDADDYVYPHWLQNFVTSISDDYDLLVQGLKTDRSFDGSRTGLEYSCGFDLDNVNALIQLYKENILGYTVVKAFRTEIIKNQNIIFDTNLRFREDEVFVLNYLRFVRRVKSIIDTGYFYFVPNFDKKYKMSVDDSIYLCESLNHMQSYFNGIQEHRFFQAPLGFLSDAYIIKMVQDDRKNWHVYLQKIKNLLRDNSNYHPMNNKLKKLILSNRFDWLSFLILMSYFYTRKIFRK